MITTLPGIRRPAEMLSARSFLVREGTPTPTLAEAIRRAARVRHLSRRTDRKNRRTVLPAKVKDALASHLERIRRQHTEDVAAGIGAVALPDAIARKYPNAPQEWLWQWVFPATRHYTDGETGERRRHHLHQSVLQKAVKAAARTAGIAKRATCHTLRTPSQRTSWRTATTSGQSKNFWGTRTSRRP